MWNCPRCSEQIEETFDTCWNCGTDEKGNVDPAFGEDAARAEFDRHKIRKPQFSLRSLLICMTCLCLIVAAARTDAGTALLLACCLLPLPFFILHLYIFLYGLLMGEFISQQEPQRFE